MNPGSSIPALHLSPRLEISQPGAAAIDTGRSNKAGRLRGHRGAAHTVTPAITTTARQPPQIPSCLSVGASRLAYLLIITVIKGGNEQGLCNHSRYITLSAKEGGGQDIVWNDVCVGDNYVIINVQ